MGVLALGVLDVLDFISSLRRSYSKHKISYWIFFIFLFNALGTWFFYDRLIKVLPDADGLDAWAIALDISLAHTVVTIPLAVCSYYVLRITLSFEFRLASRLADFLVEIAGQASCAIAAFSIFVYLLLMGITIYLVFQANVLLLIGATDLQTYIFGDFDPSLGFAYPTVFRLTTLINHFELLKQNLQANSTLSTIFGFIGVTTTAILSIVGVIKAFEYILEKSRSR